MAKNREAKSIFDTSDLTDPILQSLKSEEAAAMPAGEHPHAQAGAYAHTGTHEDEQAEGQAYPHAPTQENTPPYTEPFTDTHTHTEPDPHTDADTDTPTHTGTYAGPPTQAHAPTHTEPPAVTHPYTDTHAHTYPYAEGEEEEFKTKRMYLLVRPSVAAKINAAAKAQRTSANDLIHRLMEQYIEENNL